MTRDTLAFIGGGNEYARTSDHPPIEHCSLPLSSASASSAGFQFHQRARGMFIEFLYQAPGPPVRHAHGPCRSGKGSEFMQLFQQFRLAAAQMQTLPVLQPDMSL